MVRKNRHRIQVRVIQAEQHTISKIGSKHGISWDEVQMAIQTPAPVWVTRHPKFADRYLVERNGLVMVIAEISTETDVYMLVTAFRK
ncbi:MAG: hypothetical protein U0R28_04660 [Candidatus Nanopelagicales bacterium]